MSTPTPIPLESREALTLVLGIDGSGKSTFLNGLERCFGYEVLEPTSTPEAKDFKRQTVDTLVDGSFVDEREALYLAVNSLFAHDVRDRLENGAKVASTGSALVTRVSHALMRVMTGNSLGGDVDSAVSTWLEHDLVEEVKPASIVLVHAPDDVIMDRIRARQHAGDTTEKFWGFNAPSFLSRYQEAWAQIVDQLPDLADITCLSLDSSQLSPEEMLLKYAKMDT